MIRDSEPLIGVDLGGTKIEVVVLDGATGETLFRERRPTPKGRYQETLETIHQLVQTARKQTGTLGRVGIGTPGAIQPQTGLLKNSNSTILNGKPLKKDLEALMGEGVWLENDANCFALSEALEGAAKGAHSVFGVILGTGCGGGLVYQGQLISGANAIAGEWGHNPMPLEQGDPHAGECYCGRENCLELYLSGTGVQNRYHQIHAEKASSQEIFQRAEAGDEKCLSFVNQYSNWLARGLATVVNLFDPEVIVLGGGLSKAKILYDLVPRLWGPYIFSSFISTRLVPPLYGDSSGVRGAAWLPTRDP